MGARWIDGVFFNVLAVFVITYLVQYVDVPRTEALTVVMIAALVMCPFILFAGRLADRFGRGKVYEMCIRDRCLPYSHRVTEMPRSTLCRVQAFLLSFEEELMPPARIRTAPPFGKGWRGFHPSHLFCTSKMQQ